MQTALNTGVNLGGHTTAEERFACAVVARFPAIALVRFTNSGSEANLLAVATACAVTERREVLVFNGAYHCGVFVFGGGGSPLNAPYHFHIACYNDAEGAARVIRERADQLAAVIVEPMLGSGWLRPCPARVLAAPPQRDGRRRRPCSSSTR